MQPVYDCGILRRSSMTDGFTSSKFRNSAFRNAARCGELIFDNDADEQIAQTLANLLAR